MTSIYQFTFFFYLYLIFYFYYFYYYFLIHYLYHHFHYHPRYYFHLRYYYHHYHLLLRHYLQVFFFYFHMIILYLILIFITKNLHLYHFNQKVYHFLKLNYMTLIFDIKFYFAFNLWVSKFLIFFIFLQFKIELQMVFTWAYYNLFIDQVRILLVLQHLFIEIKIEFFSDCRLHYFFIIDFMKNVHL